MDKGSIQKQSDNIFEDILSPRGDACVYFYRIIGCEDIHTYRWEVASLDQKLRILGNYIRFDKVIPLATDLRLIDKIQNLFKNILLDDFNAQPLSELLTARGYFDSTPKIQVHQKIAAAFDTMFSLYMHNERPVNLNIVVNFITKMLLWFAEHGKGLRQDSNFKIVYWGSPKVHEIYFLILMSQIGNDVLVLNTSFTDNFTKVDKQDKFCLLLKKTKESPIGDFPARKMVEKVPAKLGINSQRDQTKVQISDHVLVTKLKKVQNLFEEFLIALPKRTGFIGKPFPVLPVYFVRYIGVPRTSDDWEKEYFNSLYNLDQTLQTRGSYIRFIGSVPAPTVAESSLIPQRITSYPYQEKNEILEQILKGDLLKQTRNELMDNTIKKALADTMTLFANSNTSLNLSILLNFSLKIVSWLNRYIPHLFNGAGNTVPGGQGAEYEYNPKILFYGDIKSHEIYLLYALHKIGCDVVFVHSHADGDQPFQNLDQDNCITSLIKHAQNLPLTTFPEAELTVRKSTVAYQASREIQEIIYSEDVGLFKPWQFESYLTEPITLKTTYDEFKILWREPSKIRPEFKIQNKKVYVPNLFAKINGVYENIIDYWQDLKALAAAPNNKIITNVPFSQTSYTRQELFQAAYLINNKGIFDDQKVVKSRYYKFGYLKMSLQHFLIAKINELIQSTMFIDNVDEKFRLKILMTILTMDDSLIKLIEVFDYPQKIPKVIVYNNQKETLSESDAILLAYFNIIGLDIVIFTPTNYISIEHYLNPGTFDVYQLPMVKFDLNMPNLTSMTNVTQKHGLLSRFLKF